MLGLPYTLIQPEQTQGGCIFASPHSGRAYSPDLLAQTALDAHSIRASEDAFVDLLFEDVPRFGAPLIAAQVPRAYVDLNRNAQALDPAVIVGAKPALLDAHIASGLGVIPRLVAQGREIYRGKISHQEAQMRLNTVWYPYHAKLADLMRHAKAAHGCAILIDCHSMPSAAAKACQQKLGYTPHIVIGDRFGAAASADIVQSIIKFFRAEGLCVAHNVPYAGAYIAQHYGRPKQAHHVVQLEINRALYMDEARLVKTAGFAVLKKQLARIIPQIILLGGQGAALAAE